MRTTKKKKSKMVIRSSWHPVKILRSFLRRMRMRQRLGYVVWWRRQRAKQLNSLHSKDRRAQAIRNSRRVALQNSQPLKAEASATIPADTSVQPQQIRTFADTQTGGRTLLRRVSTCAAMIEKAVATVVEAPVLTTAAATLAAAPDPQPAKRLPPRPVRRRSYISDFVRPRDTLTTATTRSIPVKVLA